MAWRTRLSEGNRDGGNDEQKEGRGSYSLIKGRKRMDRQSRGSKEETSEGKGALLPPLLSHGHGTSTKGY